jgi:DNA-binding YbaB/EbfC family protein
MFDGLKNLNNLRDLMKNAGQLQSRMQEMQERLGQQRITADSAAGAVAATVNGKMELVSLHIDKTRVDPTDTELLEDLIVAAVAAAQAKAAETVKQSMASMASEMGLPPGMMP